MAKRNRRRRRTQKKKHQKLKTFAKWAVVGLVAYETYMIMVDRRQKRRDAFNAALAAKSSTNKPLLVIGDPNAGLLAGTIGPDYDCADLCIDPKGCSKCKNVLAQDPLVALEGLPAGSHVVFVDSGFVERSKYPQALLEQIKRVSGGDAFFSHRQKWSLSSFSPFFRQRLLTAPPVSPNVEWQKLPWGDNASGTLQLKGTWL